MRNRPTRTTWTTAATLAVALALAACGTDEPSSTAPPEPPPASSEPEPADEPEVDDDHDMVDVAITADELRATLNRLLQEHVYLAAFATGHALQGDTAAFEAAATELTQSNTGELADVIGSVYGDDVREQFFGFWNAHIEMFVDYTGAVAEGDTTAQDDAVERLVGYAGELATTLDTLTDGALPADASQPGIVMHVTMLKDVVDAQAAGDPDAAMRALRDAAHHMDALAAAIAGAVAEQHGLDGDAGSDLAAVRSELNALLQEHVYLAGAFTGEVLSGGNGVAAAQSALIDGNSEDLADLVVAVYGDRIARDDFLQFWNSHILMFVAYTEGVAAGDEQAQQDAVDNLIGYSEDLAAAFEDLTLGELPAEASRPLIAGHITSLAPAVDAQAAGDPATAFSELRAAARHMEHIAFPLFDATVASL